LPFFAPALGTLFALGAALATYEWRRSAERWSDKDLRVPAINPLQIPAAITFAAIFAVISVVTAAIRLAFGQTGVLVLAALVGVTDIDPFVINIAQGGLAGLSIAGLCAAILIAASSNNIAKAIYALGFGGIETSRRRHRCCSFWPCWGLLPRLFTCCCTLKIDPTEKLSPSSGWRPIESASAATFANSEFSATSKVERS
jgi:uncharacterized membrane protein (DUF4010 family)